MLPKEHFQQPAFMRRDGSRRTRDVGALTSALGEQSHRKGCYTRLVRSRLRSQDVCSTRDNSF